VDLYFFHFVSAFAEKKPFLSDADFMGAPGESQAGRDGGRAVNIYSAVPRGAPGTVLVNMQLAYVALIEGFDVF
jgi:hypothetical protein